MRICPVKVFRLYQHRTDVRLFPVSVSAVDAAVSEGMLMNGRRFEFTTKVVWAVLEPWLSYISEKKCPDYEYGCECCRRWKFAESLEYDRLVKPVTLERK